MASNSSEQNTAKPVRPPNTAQLREQMPSRRTPGKTSARDPAAAPFDTDDEAAGRTAQQAAIEQAMARHNVRMARSPGGMGPLGRNVLLIVALALAALVGVWAVLSY